MRTAFISLSFLLAGSLMVPAIAHTPASKKKVATTTQKGKILPMKEYIDQLMAKMTLQEKIGQLNLMVAGDITTGGALDTQVGGDIAKGNMGGVFNIKGLDKIKALQDIAIKNSRLGIPLLVGMDVIHGYETMFPIPLALSCSWDTEAMKKVGEVSAKEASAAGINWTYSPMVDIALDARWGRISEGNGEDPYLSGVMGAALTQGYQGVDMRTEEILRADRIMACLKHFALYGAVESGKEYNTVDMSRIRMMNQYLPPYEAVVKAGVGSVMSSFNLIDYTPATANHWMMTDVLRKQWGIQGLSRNRLCIYRRDSEPRHCQGSERSIRTGTPGWYGYGYVLQCLRQASGTKRGRGQGDGGRHQHCLPPHPRGKIQTGIVQQSLPLLQRQAKQDRHLLCRKPTDSSRRSSRDLRASEK